MAFSNDLKPLTEQLVPLIRGPYLSASCVAIPSF